MNTLLLLFVGLLFSTPVLGRNTEQILKRYKRIPPAALAYIGKYFLEELGSVALETILGQEEDNVVPKLDKIIQSLDNIETYLQSIQNSLNEVKDSQTVIAANNVEQDIRVLIQKFGTLTKSLRTLNLKQDATTQERQELEQKIKDFNVELKEMPDLLYKLHLLIVGESTVAAGRLGGLACDYTEHLLREFRSASVDNYEVVKTVETMLSYRDNLMKFEVTSFQLYNSSCSTTDVTCSQELTNLNDRLQRQDERFKACIPWVFLNFKEKNIVENINIIEGKSNTLLFSEQKSSIVKDGVMDWDKIDSPQDAGLRCPTGDSSEIWSLVTVKGDQRKGYLLREKSGCYLSRDRSFIDYKKTLPTIWTSSDEIDRNEFLICLSNLTADAVTFLFYPDTTAATSPYTVKDEETGKYLSIHIEKTDMHEKIDRRLTLVLFLDDKKYNSWIIAKNGEHKEKCEGTSLPVTGDDKDNTMYFIIGGVVGGIIVIFVICCIYCRYCRDRT